MCNRHMVVVCVIYLPVMTRVRLSREAQCFIIEYLAPSLNFYLREAPDRGSEFGIYCLCLHSV